MTAITINTKGLLEAEKAFARKPALIDQAMRLAVNEAGRFGRVQSSREIFSQVNLLKGYIDERLTLKYSDKGAEPTATITGRWRPTSLSRFVLREPKRGKPVSVQVKRGGSAHKLKAFPVKLRAGKGLTDTKYNVGLAVRLKPGGTLRNSQKAKHLRSDKYGETFLLYGPSINQIFRGVIPDVTGPISNRLQSEFTRQYLRLNRG